SSITTDSSANKLWHFDIADAGTDYNSQLVIKAENPPVFKPGMRGHLHGYKQKVGRHAPSNLLRMKSKLNGFDKLGAWPLGKLPALATNASHFRGW
ncbi:MAG: hypothetical protein KKD98_08690, partial [Candidatus Thermoplasmatota archaeon]|nr:hypothetical protein [Candidatus Thermoplasmatota archaeon]